MNNLFSIQTFFLLLHIIYQFSLQQIYNCAASWFVKKFLKLKKNNPLRSNVKDIFLGFIDKDY